jgi:hypothetical protein
MNADFDSDGDGHFPHRLISVQHSHQHKHHHRDDERIGEKFVQDRHLRKLVKSADAIVVRRACAVGRNADSASDGAAASRNACNGTRRANWLSLRVKNLSFRSIISKQPHDVHVVSSGGCDGIVASKWPHTGHRTGSPSGVREEMVSMRWLRYVLF